MNLGLIKRPQFLPVVAHRAVGPIHILRVEVGHVTLRTAQVPAEVVKPAPLRVALPRTRVQILVFEYQ